MQWASFARFRWVSAPTSAELTQLTHTIAHRLARYLERQKLLVRDAEHNYLALESSDEDPMDQLRGHSITYRITVGPQQEGGGFDRVSAGLITGIGGKTGKRGRLFSAVHRDLEKLPGCSG